MNAPRTPITSVPIVDLAREYEELRAELEPAVQRVLASGGYILGREVDAFEKELAAYIGAVHAVGVNSGTDAIMIALRALGVGPGDEVLVPSMTFIATAEPVSLLGARPVFVDIDPVTNTIDPGLAREAVTKKTKAIVVVHLYGQAADLKALLALSQETGVPLVEDMAQAIGREFDGKKVGTYGALACLSFFPTKNLGACGDGGAILTSNADLAERCRVLRNHGAAVKYHHDEVAWNSRLDEIQAAILRVKLKRLDAWNDRRRELAHAYDRALAKLPLGLPTEIPGRKHVYHLYCLRSHRRDALRTFLESRRISTGLHYPLPLHLQPCYKDLGYAAGDFPEGEKLAQETLSLPLYPEMELDHIAYVADAVKAFCKTL